MKSRAFSWDSSAFDQYAARLSIMPPSFHLGDIAAAISKLDPDLLVIDYLQRLNTGDSAQDSNERIKVSRIMTALRELVSNRTIILVSALKRGSKSNYESSEMGLASFRETSEIEYAVNDAYLLLPDNADSKNGYDNRFILDSFYSIFL